MSLTTIAEVILANAKELDRRGVVDVDSKIGFYNLEQGDRECRARLITSIRELHRLALGPAETVYNMLSVCTGDIVSLQALARYNIPAHVPSAGIQLNSLASKTNLDGATLTRLVRNCIVEGIFQEPSPGQLQHTPISRLLQDPDFTALVGFYVEENSAASSRTLNTLEKWRGSREPAHTGFALANGTAEPFFKELAKSPERVERAAGAFNALPQMLVQGNDGLSRGPLWKEIDVPGATVVDVGGNRGNASMQLADATEHVRFVVQDLPGPVKMGEETLPVKYQSRVSFVVQDFFEQQAVKDADVYFLRKIMHDFPDHYCVRIIRSLVPALKAGARVVVCDRMMPETSKAGYEQREARFSDLAMLQLLNGRERSKSDWTMLFAEVDSRFDVSFEPWEGNLHGLIKAAWSS